MNPVVHFEIPVGDVAAAQEFYSQAFGWEIRTDEMPGGMTYTSVVTAPMDEKFVPKKPGAINGALIERDNKLQSPIVTVSVGSIEEAVTKVEAAGGKLLNPKGIVPEMGEFTYVSDPEGNVIGLWHDYKWKY